MSETRAELEGVLSEDGGASVMASVNAARERAPAPSLLRISQHHAPLRGSETYYTAHVERAVNIGSSNAVTVIVVVCAGFLFALIVLGEWWALASIANYEKKKYCKCYKLFFI